MPVPNWRYICTQSKLAVKTRRLEEMQQGRKRDKEKLQMQGEKLTKWQGEVRLLNNLVLQNNINSGKFFEVRLPFWLPVHRYPIYWSWAIKYEKHYNHS